MTRLFDALTAAPPERVLLETSAETVRHGEAADLACRMAAVLRDRGVRPGDRVAVQVEKSWPAVALYLACLRAGAVFLPLNPAFTPAEMAYFLTDAAPAAIVCDPARQAELTAMAPGAAVLTLDAGGAGTLRTLAGEVAPLDGQPRDRDAPAAILYTSGTTGRPKGAMLSEENLLSNASVLRDLWRFTDRDVLIHALPIFHAHGLFVAINTLMLAGGRMIWLPRFDADAVVAAMGRATAMMGVPTFYTRLLDHPGLAQAAAGMRLFISGSAPLLAETHRAFEARTGQRILERYGMTEAGMVTSNPYEGERRPGSVGPALPGCSVRISDPDTGAVLPTGATGMLEIAGPNVFGGYWGMPEKTAAEFRADGFFITGDLAQIDAQGYVTIVGRAKDLVITGGYNVYPREVEAEIDALPEVAESAVIGLPHPDFGEGVTAVVVPAPGAEPEAVRAAVQEGLAGRLARYKQPKAVILATALPRNAMGKVQKALLREAHAGLYARPAGAAEG